MPLELVANLWTLTGHPRPSREWSPERKIRAAAEAGFTALTGGLDEPTIAAAREAGLRPIGWFWAVDSKSIRDAVRFFSWSDVRHVTVFLGTHDVPPSKALALALELQ